MWKGGIFLLENIRLKEKIMESLASVLPLTAIVFILSITLLPLSSGALVLFLFGAVMLIIGMGFFTMGADMSMMPMGEGIGMEMSRTKNIGCPLLVCFILGMLITIAEPDLQVLAEQVPAIPNKILILSVAAGVGLFLMIAQIRIFFHIPLAKMLWVFYPLVFLLAFLAPDSFIPVSFDSGGVTTGPVTVPFIMALGIGLATLRSDKKSREDSFGLISLCSIGPILAVLLLGIFYEPDQALYSPTEVPAVETTRDVALLFTHAIPEYFKEVAVALIPIAAAFAMFQILFRRYKRHQLMRVGFGFLFTYIGLAMFLCGVNVGFMPVGQIIGAGIDSHWDGDWVFHCCGRACGSCADQAGRRNFQRLCDGKNDANGTFCRGMYFCRDCDAADFDGDFGSLVLNSGVCVRAGADTLRFSDFYGDCIRQWRRCLRPDDGYVFIALCNGGVRGSGRQCDDGCVWHCCDGSHDTIDYDSDDGLYHADEGEGKTAVYRGADAPAGGRHSVF